MNIDSKKQTLESAVLVLNELLHADTIATSGIFSTFVSAHISTARDSTIDAFVIGDNQVALGTLGIINGLIAYNHEGRYYHIGVEYREQSNIISMFKLMSTEI